MMYSEPNEAIFCFCCILFGIKSSALTDPKQSYTNWKKMERLKEHENSSDHVKYFLKWKIFEKKLKNGEAIDDCLQNQIKSEEAKWRHILKVILNAILYCANNNLGLRGHSDVPGSPSAGHFLNLLSLISKYDPLLKEHIESHKKGYINYFSHQIQDEFIALLSKKVRNEIIHQIKFAKYYTIMFDCTPYVSRTEQMNQVIRYVRVTDGKVFVEESVLGFIESHEKTGNGLTTEILHQISLDGLDIQNCRGQAYDNGQGMDHEFICLLTVCNFILSSIDCANVFLQKKKTITVCQAAKMIDGLIKEITDLRNNRINILFQDAEQLSKKRKKRVKRMDFDESADEWDVSAKNNCIINLKNICDVLLLHLSWRFKTLNDVSLDFSFLTGSELFEKETDILVKAAADLALQYNKT
ncbi:hypothetical protein QTP88_019665 [Uroleucon formosanum]